MRLTVLHPNAPRTRPPLGRDPGYQVTAVDYINVSHLDVRGEYPLTEMMRINVDNNADPRNIETMLEGMEMKERKRNAR